MASQELEAMPLVDFHGEVRLALISYYEGIVKMKGASSVRQKVSYKRFISSIKDPSLGISAPNAVDDTGSAGAAGESAAARASQAEPEAEAGSEAAAPAKPGRTAGGKKAPK